MLTVKIHGLDDAVKDLKRFRRSALPYAMRNALNTAVFQAQREWRMLAAATFTERSTFLDRSIRIEKADTRRLYAKVGSTFEGMAKQEAGGTVTGSSGRKPIPGPVAAGLSPGSKRTKLVRARFYLGAIKVAHPGLRGSRHQRNAIAMAVAKRQGQKVALLERPSGAKGLFQIGGTKSKPTARLLWDVSRSSVHVQSQPTLRATLLALQPKLPHMYLASLVEQAQRYKIAGY